MASQPAERGGGEAGRAGVPGGWPSVLNSAECHAVPDVEVLKDRLTARYTGKGNHANDHGSVRSAEPVPQRVSIYYYEVRVEDGGFRGVVTVGFSPPNFKLTRQVGTKASSYGYRGDDGRKFSGQRGRGVMYGPFFSTSDVVGCGVNFYTNEVFYTKNGRYMGAAFEDVPSWLELYPTVSLHSPGERVSFNFGQRPFEFDIDSMRAEARARVEEEVSRAEAEPRACVPLIRAYLAHRGHYETLRAFESLYGFQGGAGTEAGAGSAPERARREEKQQHQLPAEDEPREAYNSILRRKFVCGLVTRGEIQAALSKLRLHYPELLEKNRSLLFQLHCQEFVEIMREGRVDDALAYVRGQLAAYKGDSEVPHEQLSAVIGMVAYVDVASSPAAHLLEQGRRDEVADRVNSAILEQQGQPARPALETLVRQLRVVHRHLRRAEDAEV